jgi:hypothetical protein
MDIKTLAVRGLIQVRRLFSRFDPVQSTCNANIGAALLLFYNEEFDDVRSEDPYARYDIFVGS